jgi:glyoxylase-like metal-dependent hydrolase (beta-lactamase superfamily II)
MGKKIIAFLTIVLLIVALSVLGQQQKPQPPQYRQEPAPVSVHEISKHVYEVRGGMGDNCSFIVGDNEVYVIDAKMSDQSAKDMIRAIKETTDKPISSLLITHSDGDHVNGIPGFPEDIDIIAHKNSAKHMRAANETGSVKLPLPNETFFNRMNLYSGSLEISLFYFGPAHTDGDIVVYIPDDKVAILGDLFFKDRDPLIHMHKNGSSEGLVKVLQEIIDLNADVYLSGHAEPVKKAEIVSLYKTLSEKRNKVKTLVKEGKSLDQVKEAFGIPLGESRWPSLVEVIYSELTKEK